MHKRCPMPRGRKSHVSTLFLASVGGKAGDVDPASCIAGAEFGFVSSFFRFFPPPSAADSSFSFPFPWGVGWRFDLCFGGGGGARSSWTKFPVRGSFTYRVPPSLLHSSSSSSLSSPTGLRFWWMSPPMPMRSVEERKASSSASSCEVHVDDGYNCDDGAAPSALMCSPPSSSLFVSSPASYVMAAASDDGAPPRGIPLRCGRFRRLLPWRPRIRHLPQRRG